MAYLTIHFKKFDASAIASLHRNADDSQLLLPLSLFITPIGHQPELLVMALPVVAHQSLRPNGNCGNIRKSLDQMDDVYTKMMKTLVNCNSALWHLRLFQPYSARAHLINAHTPSAESAVYIRIHIRKIVRSVMHNELFKIGTK